MTTIKFKPNLVREFPEQLGNSGFPSKKCPCFGEHKATKLLLTPIKYVLELYVLNYATTILSPIKEWDGEESNI